MNKHQHYHESYFRTSQQVPDESVYSSMREREREWETYRHQERDIRKLFMILFPHLFFYKFNSFHLRFSSSFSSLFWHSNSNTTNSFLTTRPHVYMFVVVYIPLTYHIASKFTRKRLTVVVCHHTPILFRWINIIAVTTRNNLISDMHVDATSSHSLDTFSIHTFFNNNSVFFFWRAILFVV
jgi:hypothetical protein